MDHHCVCASACKHTLSVVRLLSAFVMLLSNSYLWDLHSNHAAVQCTRCDVNICVLLLDIATPEIVIQACLDAGYRQ